MQLLKEHKITLIIRSFFLFFLFVFGYNYLNFFLNSGFSPSSIHSPKEKSVNTNLKEDLPPDLFNQSFSFINRGSQCFVFLGDDHTTILKFFRCNRYFPKCHFWPFKKKWKKKQEEWKQLQESCHIAYQNLREESGLLYLHLGRSEELPYVKIKDKLGRAFLINLSEISFIVQKRALLLEEFLADCEQKGQQERAKRALNDLILLIRDRNRKNIGDNDLVITKNIGFLDSKPIFIDIGQFYRDTDVDEASDFEKIVHKAEPWFQAHYPNFFCYLTKNVQRVRNSI